jgi:hypothetical protein
MSQDIIQTIGTLTKKETLASVQDEMNCNILMLESQQPFPGYHGSTVPDLQEPDSLFALTSGTYSSEFIIRSVHDVNKEVAYDFSATPGTIQFKNGLSEVIRFKGLSYNKVGEVIARFSNAGIGFRKHRKIAPYSSIIKIRKFFKVEKIASRLFHDLFENDTYYLQIPAFLDWDVFEKMTNEIKYNLQNNNFDAALTSVFYEKGIMDLIRIYDVETGQKKLYFILEKYLEAIKRL